MVHPNPHNTWLGSFIKRTWYHHCSCKYLLLFDDINRRSIRHARKPGMPRNSILRILALHLSSNTCYPAQFCKSFTFFSCKIFVANENVCVICSNMQRYAATNQYWSWNYHMHGFHQLILNYATRYLKWSLSVQLSYLQHGFINALAFQT